jgi:hypothetical protein
VQLDPALRSGIDEHERTVVRLRLEIRRAARLAIQLPYDLATDHFFTREAADDAPDHLR